MLLALVILLMLSHTPGNSRVLVFLEKTLGIPKVSSARKFTYLCPNCSFRSLDLNPSKPGCPFVCTSCGFRGNLWTLGYRGDFSVPVLSGKAVLSIPNPVYQSLLSLDVLPYDEAWVNERGLTVNKTGDPTPSSILVRSTFRAEDCLRDFSRKELNEVGLWNFEEDRFSSVISPGRILIFYMDKDSPSKVRYIRSRTTLDGIRYIGPSHVSPSAVWGWETVGKTDYLIVTEGEFKAQALKTVGFPAVGLPGMNSCYNILDRFCKVRRIKRVYVLFDSELGIDKSGRPRFENVDSAFYRLAETLSSSGIASWKISLPIAMSEKVDPDSYLKIYGPEALREIIESQMKPPVRKKGC